MSGSGSRSGGSGGGIANGSESGSEGGSSPARVAGGSLIDVGESAEPFKYSKTAAFGVAPGKTPADALVTACVGCANIVGEKELDNSIARGNETGLVGFHPDTLHEKVVEATQPKPLQGAPRFRGEGV